MSGHRGRGGGRGSRGAVRAGRGSRIYVTLVPSEPTTFSEPPPRIQMQHSDFPSLGSASAPWPCCPYERNGMIYYGSGVVSYASPSQPRPGVSQTTTRLKKVLKIEEPGPEDLKPKRKEKHVEMEAHPAVQAVLFNPYLLVNILNNITSMNDRKNVELTCSFFNEVSRGTFFSYASVIECSFTDFEPLMRCLGPGEESFSMIAATKEENPLAVSQPADVSNLKHFFNRFSRQTMSVIFGGTPAEFAPYVKTHTIILTKDLIECFSELNKLKHLCLRNVFVEAGAAAHLKNNLIVKNCLVALCLHNITFAGSAIRDFVAIATGRCLKRITIEDPLVFVLLMQFLDSPKFADVNIETVSIYCNKNVTQFYRDVRYVEKIAAQHIGSLHFSVNFYGVRNWDQFKSFRIFLETTTLNIESLDIRIFLSSRQTPPDFPLNDLFAGLGRHRNLKKFCLSGKIDMEYAAVISRAIEELSKLKLVNTVVFHQALKSFSEDFWTHAVRHLPRSIQNLTISSAHNFDDGHAQILLQRLDVLEKFQLQCSRKLTEIGAHRLLNGESMTHIELSHMPSIGPGLSNLLNDCPSNLKAVIAGMKEKQLKEDVKKKLEERFALFDYYEMKEEGKFLFKMATSEMELKRLKDISKFLFCDQCNVDVLTDQCC